MITGIKDFYYDPPGSTTKLGIGIPEGLLQEDWCYYEIEKQAMDVALTKYNLPSREKLIGEGEEKWTRCFVTLLDLVEGDVSAETKERAKQKFNEVRVRKSKLFRIIMRVIIQGHLEGKEVKIGNTPLEMGDKKIKLNRADIHLPNECLKVFEGLINSLPSLEIKKVPKGQSDCYLL